VLYEINALPWRYIGPGTAEYQKKQGDLIKHKNKHGKKHDKKQHNNRKHDKHSTKHHSKHDSTASSRLDVQQLLSRPISPRNKARPLYAVAVLAVVGVFICYQRRCNRRRNSSASEQEYTAIADTSPATSTATTVDANSGATNSSSSNRPPLQHTVSDPLPV
jgi:hypothetical protein